VISDGHPYRNPERRFQRRNGGAASLAAPKRNPKTPPDISLLQAKNGLDNGVHFNRHFPISMGFRSLLWPRMRIGRASRTVQRMSVGAFAVLVSVTDVATKSHK
jgi:hypothetical protein